MNEHFLEELKSAGAADTVTDPTPGTSNVTKCLEKKFRWVKLKGRHIVEE
jgi:hypothetical protein